jgi:Mg2+-importing ATPase
LFAAAFWEDKPMMRNKTPQTQANMQLIQKMARADARAVLKQLKTSSDGLSPAEAETRLKHYGPNRVAEKKSNTKLRFLAEAFLTPFTFVLLLLATISLFTNYLLVPADQKDLSTVIIMLTMVLISGLTSFVQNVRTSSAVEDLLKMVSVTTNIKRGGTSKERPTTAVVPGDIISVAAGDIVPADMRLLSAKDLFCSASSLNGESRPAEKIASPLASDADTASYLDYQNILYEGTTIVSGTGIGVVFATGSQTVFGRLAQKIAETDLKSTSFDTGIKNISKLLLTMTAIIAPLVFVINAVTKGNWLNALLFAIATAVGLTPEMLPVIVTSNLVKGSVEMSKHGTIVKKMNSIQNFGAADVLCTDKTGTLTEDRVVLERHYNLDLEETNQILQLSYLNSFYQTGLKNLMDRAIIKVAQRNLDTKQIQREYTKVDEIPFDFKRRKMSVVVAKQSGERILITKGAAEEMLASSNRVETGGQIKALTPERKDKILDQIQQLNEHGLRVVLLAYQKNPAEAGEFSTADEKNLILTGFLAFLDPPKISAGKTLAQLKADGITVKILTGDNAAVTKNVAGKVGLNTAKIYTGQDFAGKTKAEKLKMVEDSDLFVKLSPELKAEIISLLQENKHTVAYMGDGINDAPAMKTADVAISVDTAVDIAKQSADIILLKKDLSVLENGVRIGRQVFGNTMKYIKITLSSNFGNILSILVASSFLPFLPMQPTQLLVLDLLYGTSCLAIPFDVMDKQYLAIPRKWETKKLPKFMFYFGPTSSIFDILTFAILYFFVCPQVVGASYAAASASQKALFTTVFCAGWFVESLWTQEMVIQALRDPRLPFIHQHAAKPVMLATIGAAIIGTCFPFVKGIASALQFGPLPLYFVLIVMGLLVLYILLTTVVKKWYLQSEEFLI